MEFKKLNFVRWDHGGKNWMNANYDRYTYISSEDLIPIEELEKSLANKLLDSDRVYFTKSSIIPKYKLKELNIDKTNRINYANTLVLNLNRIKNSLYSGEEYYKIPAVDLSMSLKKGFVYLNKKNFNQGIYGYNGPPFNENIYPIVRLLEKYGERSFKGKVQTDFETYQLITDPERFNKVKLVFDESLFKEVNANTSIDEEVYGQLRNMFLSEDKANCQLAMEMMANSDYEESKWYILFLLNEFWYGGTMENKTPNFMSMLESFKKYSFKKMDDSRNGKWFSFVNEIIKEENIDRHALAIYIKARLSDSLPNIQIISLEL